MMKRQAVVIILLIIIIPLVIFIFKQNYTVNDQTKEYVGVAVNQDLNYALVEYYSATNQSYALDSSGDLIVNESDTYTFTINELPTDNDDIVYTAKINTQEEQIMDDMSRFGGITIYTYWENWTLDTINIGEQLSPEYGNGNYYFNESLIIDGYTYSYNFTYISYTFNISMNGELSYTTTDGAIYNQIYQINSGPQLNDLQYNLHIKRLNPPPMITMDAISAPVVFIFGTIMFLAVVARKKRLNANRI